MSPIARLAVAATLSDEAPEGVKGRWRRMEERLSTRKAGQEGGGKKAGGKRERKR